MKKRSMVALLVMVLGVVFLITNQPQKVNLRISQWGHEKYLIYLPLYVAIEEGLLEKRGVTASISYEGNDDQTFARVASGDADVGVGDPAFAAIAESRGFEARVIATIVSKVAIWGVAQDTTIGVISKPSDLRGYKIGTFPEPSTNFALMKELQENLGVANGIEIVQAAIGNQIPLINSGAADIAMELEPAASIAESKGYRVVFSSPAMHGSFTFTGVTTTLEVLNEKEETLTALVMALDESVRLCHSNPEIAFRVAKSSFPNLDDQVLRKAIARMLQENTLPRTVRTDPSGWERAVGIRKAIGELNASTDFSHVVDNRLLR